MEVLLVLALVGVLWLIASRRWRYRVILPMAIVSMTYVVFTTPFTVELGLKAIMTTFPQDTGEPVNAIVILGRGEPLHHQRVELAAQQWRMGRSSKIFVSGRQDTVPMLKALKQQGVPTQILDGEDCSLSTEENGLFTSVFLNPQQHQKILLITDAPHMLRSLFTFQRFGYTPIPKVSPLVSTWDAREKSKIIRREILGMVGYGITGRFHTPTEAELSRFHTTVFQRVEDLKCKFPVPS
jgi:uncharacterized SAM-binding protein YcdF (DUF218 family)